MTWLFTRKANRSAPHGKGTQDGRWKDWDVAVLVDESSASASRFLRRYPRPRPGAVIGRRTFGKGLVQERVFHCHARGIAVDRGAVLHPTGRAIQRPYGEGVDYGDDYFARYERGELFHQDSIATIDSLTYVTPAGKVVHGAGGITPDVFVALDTVRWSGYLSGFELDGDAPRCGFCLRRCQPRASRTPAQSAGEGLESDALLTFLIEYAEGEGISPPAEWTEAERSELSDRMAAQVIRQAGEQAYYTFLTQGDDAIERAAYWLENKSRMGIVDGRLTLQ